MKRKGFLFSVLTFLMFLSILMVAVAIRGLESNTQLSQKKTRSIHDDLAYDMRELIGLQVSVNKTGPNVVVTLRDTIPLENGGKLISDYTTFIEETYARELNTKINLDVVNSEFMLTPYNLVYGYPSFNKRKIRVRNHTGSADYVSGYNLTLTSETLLSSNSSSVTAGHLGFIINASFANKDFYYKGGVSRIAESSWTFTAGGKTLTVRAGQNNIDGTSKASTLVIETEDGLNATVELKMTLTNTNKEVGLRSNVAAEIKDRISRRDFFWLTPPARDSTIGDPITSTTTTTVTTTTVTSTTSTTVTTTTVTTTSTIVTTTTVAATSTTSTSTTSTSTTTTTSTTSTSTTSTTTTTIPAVADCNDYCLALGGYTGGTCRATPQACEIYETHDPGGDLYCTGGQPSDTCCCRL